MATWAVTVNVQGHGQIEVEADSEEEALQKAHDEGKFEISNVDELTEFDYVSAEKVEG